MNLKKRQQDFQSAILNSDYAALSKSMQIYHNSFYERIVIAMKNDFPILTSYLGDDGFSSMVREYLHYFPPKKFNLRLIGENLSAFLLQKDAALMLFSELARLEYAMTQVRHGEKIHFESDYPVVKIYQAFHGCDEMLSSSRKSQSDYPGSRKIKKLDPR